MSRARDLLEDYRARRDFAATSEPAGGKSAPGGHAFVVQKHDARRLHYDFRIELDGVLKSWAVTRGPSNHPADKRLAVRVEDHPLDYAGFEGTIPEGEYGGGTVMLWDRGTWEPIGDPHEGLEKGDLKMRLHGERMKGEWVLVHMKGRDKGGKQNWLLIKHDDEEARDHNTLLDRFTRSVATGRDLAGIAQGLKPKKASKTPQKAVWHSGDDAPPKPSRRTTRKPSGDLPLPEFRDLQLATLVDRVPTGDDWLIEMKYDGYRCLAAIAGQTVRLYTRSGKDWTETFADLVPAFAGLTEGSALIDGEVCAFNEEGRTDFSTLKDRLSTGGPLVYFAFDLLERDGKDLAGRPLSERKRALEQLIGSQPSKAPIQVSPTIEGKGDAVFETLCGHGFEGILAKKANAKYRGARTRTWLKIKCTRRQEFVIGGWSPSGRGNAFASLLLGTWENGNLVYRGRVGTGFSDEDRERFRALLEQGARTSSPFDKVPAIIARTAHWTAPEYVAEIAFTELTPDGYLRHPSFIGLREDKPARDVHLDQSAAAPETQAPPAGKPKGKRAPALTTETGIAAAERAGVHLTHPEKVLFPGQGITKGELVAYYEAVHTRMLAYAGDRPLSLVRCPAGRAKHCFFQKHDTGGFSNRMKRLPITEGSGEREDYFYFDDSAGIFSGVQMGVLEFHIWGSRRSDIEKPDRLVFDLDPDLSLDFADVRDAARHVRQRLADLGLKSFPLVTGGKGIHVVAPLVPRAEWPEVKAACRALAHVLAEESPERYTDVLSKARRKGRLFIDYLRNDRGSTAIAPFSTRARPGAPVAVPVDWDELDAIPAANRFSLAEAAVRAQGPDPWTGYDALGQSLTADMLAKFGATGKNATPRRRKQG